MQETVKSTSLNRWLFFSDKAAPMVQMALFLAIFSLAIFAPEANAQVWADKTNSTFETVITGLRALGVTIATMCVIWSAYQLIWGGKRLQDMVPFFIGAAVFLAGPELVALFFAP